MDTSSATYRLVVFSLPDDRDQALTLLKDSLGLHDTDAKIQLRHLPGVISHSREKDVVDRAAAEFEQLGCRAVVVDESEIPDLQHINEQHHIRLEESGFQILGLNAEVIETLPWSAFALVSVAQVPITPHKHHLDQSVFETQRAVLRKPEATTGFQRGPEMWLTCEEPFRAFHFAHEVMNYEYLGDRKTTSAIKNFRMVLEDLNHYAPHLFLTHSTRAFLNHQPLEEYEFDSAPAHREAVESQVLFMRILKRNSS